MNGMCLSDLLVLIGFFMSLACLRVQFGGDRALSVPSQGLSS